VAACVQAWQTVAAEYYDPHGAFNQAEWASQLLSVMKAHGGALHTRADTYKALTEMVASLGDKYSTFLDPSVSETCRTQPVKHVTITVPCITADASRMPHTDISQMCHTSVSLVDRQHSMT
jgi:hypothetical protein